MAKYESIQDVLDSTSKEDIKAQLTELGVEFHHANGEAKLATLLFEALGGEQETKSDNSADRWKSIAENITKEVKQVKKDRPNKMITFLGRNFSMHVSPFDQKNKQNKRMRYVIGYNTLDPDEQQATGSSFPQEYIRFKGLGGMETKQMGSFVGRSIFQTKDPILIEYLTNYHSFGSQFVIYDETQKDMEANRLDRKMTLLKNAMYTGEDNDLISTLAFIDLKTGTDSFKRLSRLQRNQLEKIAKRYIENNPDSFLEAMESDVAKAIHLLNLAEEDGVIKVTSDGREVKWTENNKTFCKSSLSTDWQTDCVNLLSTPEGKAVFKKLQMLTHYHIV